MVRQISQVSLVLSACLILFAVQDPLLALLYGGYRYKGSPYAVNKRLTTKIKTKVEGMVFHPLLPRPEVYCRTEWLSKELNQFALLALYAGGTARKIKGSFALDPGGFITIPPEKIEVSSPYYGQDKPRQYRDVVSDHDAELTWLSLNDFRASESRKLRILSHRVNILNRVRDTLHRTNREQLTNGVHVVSDALDFGQDDILDSSMPTLNEIVIVPKDSPSPLTVLAGVNAHARSAGLKSLRIGRHAPQAVKDLGAKRDQLDWIQLNVSWSRRTSNQPDDE